MPRLLGGLSRVLGNNDVTRTAGNHRYCGNIFFEICQLASNASQISLFGLYQLSAYHCLDTQSQRPPELKLSQLLFHGVPISQGAKSNVFFGRDHVSVMFTGPGREVLPDTISLLCNDTLHLLTGDTCGDCIW